MFTALASFLQARSKQGQWLLRIDDIDTPRVAAGATDAIMRVLERYALYWDRAAVTQSSGTEAYRDALERLDAAGWLYPCSCSRKTLAALPRPYAESTAYPGTCRNARRSRRQPHALRARTGDAIINALDLLQGPQRWDIGREHGDFIVLRRDGIVSYHLATVVDDWRLGISEVLRGLMEAGRYPIVAYPVAYRFFFTFVVPVTFLTTVPAEAMLGRSNPTWLIGAGVLAVVLFLVSTWFWAFALRFYTSASS